MSDQQIAQEKQAPTWREGTSFHEAEIGTTITARPTRLKQTLRFLLHFAEMVLAMMVGMAVFALVNSMILIPRGFVYLSASVYPQAYALAMAVSMTVAMVAWMLIRKHPRRLSAEMAGAMLVPTVLLIAICWIAHLPSEVLLTGTHILMLPAMLAVMLYRWRDYAGH
jgi:flagellar biosynthetic protein FliP